MDDVRLVEISYEWAVKWVAANLGSPGPDRADPRTVQQWAAVRMVAAMFDCDVSEVVADILRAGTDRD